MQHCRPYLLGHTGVSSGMRPPPPGPRYEIIGAPNFAGRRNIGGFIHVEKEAPTGGDAPTVPPAAAAPAADDEDRRMSRMIYYGAISLSVIFVYFFLVDDA